MTTRVCWAVKVVGALVVGIVVSACSSPSTPANGGGSGAPRTEPSLGEIRHMVATKDMDLPLDYFLESPQQEALITNATIMFTNDCLRRFGFTRETRANVPLNPHSNNKRYGISDINNARKYGYHTPPEEDLGSPETMGKNVPIPSAAEQAVMNGSGERTQNGIPIPEGGCRGETNRALARDKSNQTGLERDTQNFVLGLSAETGKVMEADSRVLAVFGKWSECMKSRGFDYKDPWAANNNPQWKGRDPSPKEIASAVADIECREQTNVVGVQVAVETAYQKQTIEENAQDLAKVRAKLENRVKKATEIVQGHPQ